MHRGDVVAERAAGDAAQVAAFVVIGQGQVGHPDRFPEPHLVTPVDPETGEVTPDRYTVVDDIGTVINPLLARGQIQGGVAQGAGQALLEDVIYDRESGQLLTGTLLDYGIPRADTMPVISIDFSPVPSTTNPLGAKGVGEGGTVASTPTVMNAILDALAPLGVTDVAMPATPERIWRAVREHAKG